MQDDIDESKGTRNFLIVVIVALVAMLLFISSDYRRAQRLETLVCDNLDLIDYDSLSEVHSYCTASEEIQTERKAGREKI